MGSFVIVTQQLESLLTLQKFILEKKSKILIMGLAQVNFIGTWIWG